MVEYYPRNIYRNSFLNVIFKEDSKGNTSEKSLTYQHIIKYFLKDVFSYYKVREVENKVKDDLVHNTKNKKDDQHSLNYTKSIIIEHSERTFRKYFQNLVDWGILTKRQTIMEKGTGSTFEYQITKFGHFLALMIDVGFNRSKESFDKLYSFLESYFNDESYSLDRFCKSYLKKCKENSLFEIFIEYFRKNVIYQNIYIENERDLFIFMVFLRTSDKRLNKKLWKLWFEFFNELGQHSQELLIYHLKLVIDRIISRIVLNHGAYESVSFACKDIKYRVTVEYRCLKCDAVIFYNATSILVYLQKLFLGIKHEKIKVSDELVRCGYCKGKRMNFATI